MTYIAQSHRDAARALRLKAAGYRRTARMLAASLACFALALLAFVMAGVI